MLKEKSARSAPSICPELYFRALRRIGELESGTIRYKANDMDYKSDDVTNCIHAVSTIGEGIKLRVGSLGWGEVASFYVLQELEPWILQAGCTHPWVGSALGLDQYPIIYRDFTNPRSGFGAPIYRFLGGERELQATPMR
jgi:hypothetical protein